MLKHRLAAGTALGMMILAFSGCAKDKNKDKDQTTDEANVDDDNDGTIDERDEGEGGDEDEGEDDDDDGSIDGGRGGNGRDGGAGDGGGRGLDAGSDEPAGPKCDVTHPTFGCGTISSGGSSGGTSADGGVAPGGNNGGTMRDAGGGTMGPTRDIAWVKFDSGVEVDYRTGLGWYKVELGPNDADSQLRKKCADLEQVGIDDWKIPEMKEVRTLAAGCAATQAGGTCKINEGDTPVADGQACVCTNGTGPHASGGFCRPEVPDCVVRWADTHSGDEHGPQHQHWFYDVKSGSIVLQPYKTDLANAAQGYCVTEKPIASLPR